MRTLRNAMVMVFAVLSAAEARAQIFSPGDLSKAHSALDGIGSCKKCHVEGNQHDNRTCLECHKEIARRIDADLGFHRTTKEKKCAECHREHRGVKAKLIEWTPSLEAFNHKLTGWPLEGAHKKADCKTCHETRRMSDSAVKAIVAQEGRESFLGVTGKCTSCHFDEHRGQEGDSCQRCHNQDTFKAAPKFNHNVSTFSKFALTGKHASADCRSCHEPLIDKKTPDGAWPAPVDVTYLQMKGIPHASCVDCHDDAHNGKLGADCLRCHSPESWHDIKAEGVADRAFHDKHAFPLRGAHRPVACKSCHGPFAGKPALFKGVKFAACADCHADAHIGQLQVVQAQKCEQCHDVNGFVPVLFDRKAHEATRFPLAGSHRAVACNRCHKADADVRSLVPVATKRDLLNKGRPVRVSAARLAMPDVVGAGAEGAAGADCTACHEDVHAGQFTRPAGAAAGPPSERVEAKSCSACHAMTAAFADSTFAHDSSRFPLSGKHKEVACAACHSAEGPGVVVYRPLALSCASCHADEHVGQFSVDCASCHTTAGFLPATFTHEQSAYALEGQHQQVACIACHQRVAVEGKNIVQYKPVPMQCGACHEDQHQRAFDGYYPQLAATTTAEPRCDGCHVANGWLPGSFAHERTGFPLSGKHAGKRCASCHGSDINRPVPATCVSCHQDPHAQEFGLMCSACHTTEVFSGPSFPVDAHRRTNFPLSGRHASLPCDECHVEKRESMFTRAAIDCGSCHAKDARAASLVTVDHARPPFSGGTCASCHIPVTFAPARFPQHEPCFPLARGAHVQVRCNECHANLPGTRFTGTCTGVPVLCATCHVHAAAIEDPRHAAVPGYEFKSAKCASCHRDGG